MACSEWVLRLSIVDTKDQTEGCLRSGAKEAPFIGRSGGAKLIPANPKRFVLNLLNNSTHLFSIEEFMNVICLCTLVLTCLIDCQIYISTRAFFNTRSVKLTIDNLMTYAPYILFVYPIYLVKYTRLGAEQSRRFVNPKTGTSLYTMVLNKL